MRTFAFCGVLMLNLAVFLTVGSQSTMAQSSRGWFGQGDSGINLLQSEKVREDLELVDDQVNELQKLRDQIYQEMRDMWSGMRDLSREERREKFAEIRADMEARRGEIEEQINGVLLPHQQKRLSQLSMQNQARREGGTIGFASSDKLAEKLNLTEEQKVKLKKAAEEAKKELEQKIKSLREKAEQKVLSVLTTEQRDTYNDLMGDSFKFEERNRWWENRDRNARRSEEGRRNERQD